MAKPLLKLTTHLKNSLILSKYFSSTQVCSSSSQVPGIRSERVLTSVDVFELLKEDKNPISLVSNIQANKNVIDGRHVVVALTSMQKFYQMNSLSTSDVQKSEPFQSLCSFLNPYLTKLDTPQLIQTLKVLSMLEVPSSTIIVQSILQILRNSINSLSLDQIYYLTFVLKQMKSTHLSDAMLEALPEVFVSQLELQLDKDNVQQLRNALRYASNHVHSKEVIKYIIDALNNCKSKFDSENALSILWSICSIKDLPDGYLELLLNVQDVLIKDVNQLKQVEIMNTFTKIFSKTMKRVDGFYNPILIDKLINQVVADDYGYNKGTIVLNLLNKLKHINIPLLDYLSFKCHKNPAVFLESHPLSLSELVSGFALANHKPSIWNETKEIILNQDPNRLDDPTLCYFTYCLASLDVFDTNLIKKVFTSDQNPIFMSFHYLKTFQALCQCVQILYPEYNGPWPSKELIESFESLDMLDKLKAYPLLPALEKISGGPSFIRNNLKTTYGIEIDHLIVLQDERPIALESKSDSSDIHTVTKIDDLIIPENTQRVAVLVFPPEVYGRNIKRLHACTIMKMKTLEAMSYKIVSVSSEQWLKMPDHEKLPYLQNLIGIKN